MALHGRCHRVVSRDAAIIVRQHKYLETLSMEEGAAQTGRVRSFGSVTSQGIVAKYLSEEAGETMSPCLPV